MLQCVHREGCGRLVVAAKNIKRGEIVFSEEAYCVSPNVGSSRGVCIFCSSLLDNPTHLCSECGHAFCSEKCFQAYAARHKKDGECAALLFSKSLRSVIPKEDYETFQMTCLVLARCVAEGKEQRLTTATIKCSQEVETIGGGLEQVNPATFFSDEGLKLSTYDHVECLVTNLSTTNPEIVADFSALESLYQKYIAKRKHMSAIPSATPFLPCEVSQQVFLSICTAFLCNGFGLWDSNNRKLSTAVFPQSSYFNHCCAPNLGRRNIKQSRCMQFFATRDVSAGEPLCISYVDVKLPATERKAKLFATYAFSCQCQRCCASDCDSLGNAVSGGLVPPLCANCVSKILQYLPAEKKLVCPCCNDVVNDTS